jgi:hypothetical protein
MLPGAIVEIQDAYRLVAPLRGHRRKPSVAIALLTWDENF